MNNNNHQGTYHQLSLAPGTINLYASTSANSYCNVMGSQTPGPNMNGHGLGRLSKIALTSDTASPQLHAVHHGSMTPQHHSKIIMGIINSEDAMIFFTPEPAYKLVVTILKQNPSGLTVEQFKNDLERRMSMSLKGCDFNDFLMR